MALTYCLVLDVWKNSEALVQNFKKRENDPISDKKVTCKYQGLLKQITYI
jgi:hypothetical protein